MAADEQVERSGVATRHQVFHHRQVRDRSGRPPVLDDAHDVVVRSVQLERNGRSGGVLCNGSADAFLVGAGCGDLVVRQVGRW
ncbi:MAG TPA: hypothetical protein VMA96_12000, partial [Solirubrobacteraceae bacterium]|nr:hypothetical protein [Solirubrobacteraceae bacterium]